MKLKLLKSSFFLLSFLLFGACSLVNNKIKDINTKPVKRNQYKLVWSDEFNNNGKPDTNSWNYDIGAGGWGNNELQFYSSDDKSVKVLNGHLVITAYKSENNKKITSARIVTKNKRDWLYGRIEVKAKIPSGRGTWPAIWMLPSENNYGGWPLSGEIDIMEHVGYEPNVIHGTVHTEKFNHTLGTQKGAEITIPTATTEFHIYAIEWDKNKIDFFVDENKYFTFYNFGKSKSEWPFDKKFYLIINLAIGGNWGGVKGVDESIFPVEFVIDYVRVYQKGKLL